MKGVKARIFSAVLSMAMLLSLFPATVFAGESEAAKSVKSVSETAKNVEAESESAKESVKPDAVSVENASETAKPDAVSVENAGEATEADAGSVAEAVMDALPEAPEENAAPDKAGNTAANAPDEAGNAKAAEENAAADEDKDKSITGGATPEKIVTETPADVELKTDAISARLSDAASDFSEAVVFQTAKNYGGETTDAFHDVAYTPDGGFVVMGYSFGESSDPAWTHTGSENNNDALLLKFDSDYKLSWAKAYGGDGVDILNSVDALQDGRIVALGRSSFTSDDNSIKAVSWYLLVINPDDPDDYTEYRIGGTAGDQGYGVAATSDGGFVAAGWTASKTGFVTSSADHEKYSDPVQIWTEQDRVASSGSDSLVIKFDKDGEIEYTVLHNYSVSEEANNISAPSERLDSIAVDDDDNIYLVGYNAIAKNAQNAVIAKLDGANGNLIWHRSAGRLEQTVVPEDAAEYIKAEYSGVAVLTDGSVVVTGTSTGDATTEEAWKITGVKDTIVARYGSDDGELLFSDNFGTIGDNDSRPEGIVATPDGGYIIYGSQSGVMNEDALVDKGYDWGNYGGQDAILVKYDAENKLEWTENYGSVMGDWINGAAIRFTGESDGEMIAVGESNGRDGVPAWDNYGGIDAVIMSTSVLPDAYAGTGASSSDGNVTWADGSYSATGDGYGGADSVEVTVVIEQGKIKSVDGENKNDSAAFYSIAEKLHETIVESQSANVDAASGATYSSNGIKQAASRALGKSAAAYVDDLITAIKDAASAQAAADAYAELGTYSISQLENLTALRSAAQQYGITLTSQTESGGEIPETEPERAGNLFYNDAYYKIQNVYYKNINAEALAENNLTGDGVKIAVIDSGLTPRHPDLDYSRVLDGYDYDSGVEMKADSLTDNNGHGTAVTGILAAVANNEIGVAGLLGKVQIVPLKVTPVAPSKDTDGASSKLVAQAITDAVDKYQVDVITTSLDVKATDELAQAVAYAASKGVIITAAAGNSSKEENDGNDPYVYPASYDDVISVGAVDAQNKIRSNSQKNDQVFVTAPGEGIAVLDLSLSGRYTLGGGTSYASPVVAAMAVAAKEYKSDITPAQFKTLLQTSSVDAGEKDYDTSYGYGIVDFQAFIQALKSESGADGAGTYVLMNIPYADFYAAELGADDMTADAVTSATLKAFNSAVVGGSYHEGESDGESYDILGVTYPVRAESESVLAAYRKADSEDALFSGGSYAYVPMSDAPENYKVLTLDETGKASFGAVQSGTSKETLSAELDLTVLTRRGDYEITYRDEDAVKAIADSVVLGEILTASDGHKYPMRHLENIWENIEMALCTGHSDTIKNVNKEDALTPSQSGYDGLEGSTVTGITYYVKNADGEYQTFEVNVNLPIPVYPSASFTDSRTIQLIGLPQADLETVRTVTKENPENVGTTKERFYAAYVDNQEMEHPQPLVLTENPISMEVSDDGAVIIRMEDAAESGERYAVRVIQDRTKRATPDQLLLINVDAVWNASGGSGADGAGTYVLMNIPYADFYAAELGENAEKVDAVTSATKSKPRTGGLAGGSYHVNDDGSDISGVIYPVLVQNADLLKDLTQVTDESKVSITVTNRGQPTTTDYEGKDALFESANYSYYILDEKPALYKTLTVNSDNTFTFSEIQGDAEKIESVTGEVTVGGHHTDIEIKLTGTSTGEGDDAKGIAQGAAVSGVVLTDSDGAKYGLRHIVNIWRATELGWNLGELDLNGKKIVNIRYITQDAVYDYPVEIEIANPAYVLMNIPYSDFYAAELGENAAQVDAVTSATKSKPRTGTLAGGSYHVNDDGSDISGVIYPVLVQDIAVLDGKTQVTDESKVSITVTNRGQTTPTDYVGKDALFESADYSYYMLDAKPTKYKVLSVSENGEFNFGAIGGRATSIEGVTGEVTVGGHHTDIEIKLTGTVTGEGDDAKGIAQGAAVSGVVLTDGDGAKYGLRHIVNIWRATELGWNLGELDLNGKKIVNIRYITQENVYDYPVEIEIANPAYVLMNIPYSDFYAAELDENAEKVDAVTTATVKTYNQNMAAGSYHNGYLAPEDIKDAKILGVTYPVFVQDIAVLDGKTKITDEAKATITVATGKSSTEEREVTGVDVLFASGDYAYYMLDAKPARYKTLSVSDNGDWTFGAVNGRAVNIDVENTDGIEVNLTYNGHYTDRTLSITDENLSEAILGGVVLTVKDSEEAETGALYPMRHVKNVWRKTEIGWNTAELDFSGKIISNIKYITRDAVYNYAVNIYVKPAVNGEITAAFTDADKIEIKGLPDDITNALATVTYVKPAETEGQRGTTVAIAESVAIQNNIIALSEAAVSGTAYTVKIISDNYADVSISNVTLNGEPTGEPTQAPTGEPTQTPTGNPTPTGEPTQAPTVTPTTTPTRTPSGNLTPTPTAAPAASGGGCYVATAVYGSYDCPEVWTLRRFRDEILADSWYGRLFIRAYYAVSPTAVKLFGDSDLFRNFFQGELNQMVSALRNDGFESGPYQDIDW